MVSAFLLSSEFVLVPPCQSEQFNAFCFLPPTPLLFSAWCLSLKRQILTEKSANQSWKSSEPTWEMGYKLKSGRDSWKPLNEITQLWAAISSGKDNISRRKTHIYITMKTCQDTSERSCGKVKLWLNVYTFHLLIVHLCFTTRFLLNCNQCVCVHTWMPSLDTLKLHLVHILSYFQSYSKLN